jgi:digeranylgeranylglycerophospholipid reductase
VRVFEEHLEVGIPTHCAGLLSVSGLESLGISRATAESRFVLNKIRGARFHSPKGQSVTVDAEDIKAYAVDRVAFDKYLCEEAEKQGVKVALGKKIESISIGRDAVKLHIRGGEQAEAGIVIDGEGAAPRLLQQLGLGTDEKISTFPAAQYEIECRVPDPELVEVFLGKSVAPGFFAWSIPTSMTRTRLGIAVQEGNAIEFLEKLRSSRFRESVVRTKTFGRILAGGPMKRLSADRAMVVGDAAGHVKATTGGGVILGGLCAKIAGKRAAQAVKTRDFSASNLRGYDRECEREFGSEFSKMALARQVMSRMEDDAVEKLFQVVRETGILEKVRMIGDIDLQSSIIDLALRNPAIWKALLPIARRMLFPS